MQAKPSFIAALGLLATLSVGTSQAAPPDQERYPGQPAGQQPDVRTPAQQPANGNGRQQAPASNRPAANPATSHAQQPHGQPPKDFSAVHQSFQQRRDQIGRGPALPPNVHIVKGQPLPKGYGKRLDARALQGLPQYQGYEWRRVGSDVVLVTVATGIVYTILSGVLN